MSCQPRACQPVQFCSPPNWHTDFPDLIGPTGPTGQLGPTGPVAVTGLKVILNGDLESGQVYTLDLKAWDGYTITDLAGTATVTLKINGVAITGLSGISLTTVKADFLGTALNTVNVGDEVSISIDSATNAFNLELSINTIPA